MSKNTFIICILVILSVLSGAVNIYLVSRPKIEPSTGDFDRFEADKFPLLSRRIFIDNFSDILINFTSLRADLRAYVKNADADSATLGVYFEYLGSGSSIGVNDTETFATASLIKVPVVMAVYKEIENGRLNLDQQVTITTGDLDEHSGQLYKRGSGTQLTLREIIELTLVESDNTAFTMLLRLVGGDNLTQVYNALDVVRTVEEKQLKITPKHYASIIRSLFLSSYLTRQSSSEILSILTRTSQRDLLQSGVPENIKVAHKYGLVVDDINSDNDTLSDCGIIYVPKRPYLLCVMVKKHPEDVSKKYIHEISQMVYEFVTTAKSAAHDNN